jgi:hypothetical protein
MGIPMTKTVKLPTHTPWGSPQGALREVAPGIYFYHTASHGGFWLAPERLREVPTTLRALRFNNPSLDSGWFEEDCDWCMVAGFFPEAFTAEERVYARTIYEHYVLPKLVALPEGWRIADTSVEGA